MADETEPLPENIKLNILTHLTDQVLIPLENNLTELNIYGEIVCFIGKVLVSNSNSKQAFQFRVKSEPFMINDFSRDRWDNFNLKVEEWFKKRLNECKFDIDTLIAQDFKNGTIKIKE